MSTEPAPAAWAIVPVKALGEAKQRLSGVLPPEARRRLMLAMLHDVLATLAQVERIARVLVVTPDAEVAGVAQQLGASVLREEQARGHSAAAAAGFAHALANGAVQALAVPADAPCVTPGELSRLLDAARTLHQLMQTRGWCWSRRATATAPTPSWSRPPTRSPRASGRAASPGTSRRPRRAGSPAASSRLRGSASISTSRAILRRSSPRSGATLPTPSSTCSAARCAQCHPDRAHHECSPSQRRGRPKSDGR